MVRMMLNVNFRKSNESRALSFVEISISQTRECPLKQ
jgi:hypothetical protein